MDEAGNIESRQLDVGDTKSMNSVRSIPLSENTLQEIERHKSWYDQEATDRGYDHHGFVFTSNSGRLLNKANVSRSLARACRRAGVTERHFHTRRATFITRLARAGVPIQIVSALAGHSDISVTARYYIGVSETEKKDAISKLDGGMVAKDIETNKTKGK
jgi:integrase